MEDSEVKTRVTTAPAPPRHKGTGEECLVLIYPPGPNLGKRYVLDKPFLTLGRDNENDIVVDKDSVSRRHARVALQDGARVVLDLGSTNGTYVNDRPIRQHTLTPGDQIKVGETIFKYLTGQDVEQSYHEEIYRMTIIDGLTELFNKRYFHEAIEGEVARARRYRRDLSLLMFDIDHFKRINDTFGHLAGDSILKDLGKLVVTRARREEIVSRYGGEEFAVLVPETGLEGAMELADQLRAKVEGHEFSFEGEVIPVTVSVGVATLEGEEWGPTEFVKAADEQLYRAKAEGRNRVCGGGSCRDRDPAGPPAE